jgi:hypothetical protein
VGRIEFKHALRRPLIGFVASILATAIAIGVAQLTRGPSATLFAVTFGFLALLFGHSAFFNRAPAVFVDDAGVGEAGLGILVPWDFIEGARVVPRGEDERLRGEHVVLALRDANTFAAKVGPLGSWFRPDARDPTRAELVIALTIEPAARPKLADVINARRAKRVSTGGAKPADVPARIDDVVIHDHGGAYRTAPKEIPFFPTPAEDDDPGDA